MMTAQLEKSSGMVSVNVKVSTYKFYTYRLILQLLKMNK